MATSRSDAGPPARKPTIHFSVVAGGAPSPQEVAAIAAALEAVLAAPAEAPPVSRWRWSGRWWQGDGRSAGPDWRWTGPAAHPSSR